MAALDEAIRRAASPSTDPNEDTRKWAEARGGDADTAVHRGESDTRTPSRDGEPLPFRRLGHFEILAEIGRGGMGNVYKGYDEQLQRTVAVKVLPAELARDAEFVKRLHAEARAVAKLDHENVVSVHFSGQASDHHFFAMQYIQGESLARRLERCEHLAVDAALDVAEQTLAGLDAAHAEGLIHRDVKPGNILIESGTERVVLVDFGLVRTVGEGSRITAAGTVLGTVDYIAPEQARGASVDHRADLYSVGVLLYRLLAGNLPFAADNPSAVIYRHIHETAPPLCEVASNVPAEVGEIVARLLAKDPADRYQTAAEALDAIRACRHQQTVAPPVTQAEPAKALLPRKQRSRQFRVAAIVASLVAVALLIAMAVAPQLLSRDGDSDRPTETTTAAADVPDKEPPRNTPASEPAVVERSNTADEATAHDAAELKLQPSDDPLEPLLQVAARSDVVDLNLDPGNALPRGRWVDVLRHLDLSWHVVSGEWRREENGITVDPSPMSRIMLPVEIDGDYDLRAEFTRTTTDKCVNIMIPVGQRACQLTLAGGEQKVHGLGMIDGHGACAPENPAVFRPGSLVKERRYRVLISVRIKNDEATVDASLDGKPLIAWEGKQSSLSIAPVWQLPYQKRAGLGANDATVTFHAASLRSVSGTTKLTAAPSEPFEQAPEESWNDLLAGVDLDRDTIQGYWCRLEEGIAVAPASAGESNVRLMLPEVVEGSYDLVAELTRTNGSDSATIILPVGTRACTLHLSACEGRVSGLGRIDGRGITDPLDPAVRRPGGLVNAQRYKALVSVRLLPSSQLNDHDVLIDVWLDGRPLVRWTGRESSLSLDPAWSLPERGHVAIGANKSFVTFHALQVRGTTDR
jgi:serine/threonine protein kinase